MRRRANSRERVTVGVARVAALLAVAGGVIGLGSAPVSADPVPPHGWLRPVPKPPEFVRGPSIGTRFIRKDDVALQGPGAVGPLTAHLQHKLLALGYWLPSADGIYGTTTTQAVYAFQKVQGLPRTGVIDAATQQAFRTAHRPQPRSPSGTLAELDRGRQVMFLVADGRVQWAFNTSTGRSGWTTPLGRFRIYSAYNGMLHGSLGDLYRPRFFTGGIAFHGSASIPPYPASHGCSRLTNAAADFLWATNALPIGLPVWVYE